MKKGYRTPSWFRGKAWTKSRQLKAEIRHVSPGRKKDASPNQR